MYLYVLTSITFDYLIDYLISGPIFRGVNGYTKLFSDIVTSTIWQEPNDCRVLWITLLALKDKDHLVRATVPFLARSANISTELCEEYLRKFQKPDKWSRSQEHEGRRIEAREDGWFVLNGEKYRDRLATEDRREQIRRAVAKHREKKAKKRARGKTIRPEHVPPLVKPLEPNDELGGTATGRLDSPRPPTERDRQ